VIYQSVYFLLNYSVYGGTERHGYDVDKSRDGNRYGDVWSP